MTDVGGTLYLVATPIGNLEDITFRAVRVLKEADLIACEDTRQTRKLLDHYGIARPLISYHEHNEAGRAAELAVKLKQGRCQARPRCWPRWPHRDWPPMLSTSAAFCRRRRRSGAGPWRRCGSKR